RRIAYREHLGRFNRTLGMLCRLYIGGTAHELGHALGLPHNEATPSEGFRWGVALMGSGNFAWRGEQVGKPGAFLTTASVARLLSHPLMTQSNRQRFAPTLAEMDQVHFAARADGGIHLSGSVLADPPAYALIADTDPEGGANYDSHTWTAAVNEQGHFSLDITTLRSVPQELRLTVCHLNGGSSTVIRLPFGPRADADAMAADLTSTLSWRQAEADYLAGKKDRAAARCQQALPQATASIAPRLQHMLKLARGQAATQPLSVLEGDEIHLADVTPELADVGWGAPRRNECYNPPGINQGVCLIVGGAFYSSGLYAHSPSKLRYSLDGTWHRFEATVGLQQGAHQVGTGVFIVRGDGKELARVGPLRMDESAKIQADITGVRQLELVTEPDGESNASSWTVWAAPRLMR
ncbi:MAG: NPCBM/NEW2 domain-containing protein, partial [Verrucomicrobiales bacterium]|nr:NPCBM/NEW2 domain-containing protein [Verrucomicrobiales bacterium]